MSITSKIFFLIPILMSLGIASQAQGKGIELSATTGFVVNFEDLGAEYHRFTYGGHLGFNLYAKKAKRFRPDLQASMNISGGGNSSSSFVSINALGGGRYYFTDPAKPTTAFFNALIGGVYIGESGDDFIDNRFGFGYSAGFFVDINRFITGISAESFNNFIFKMGYTF